MNNKLKKAGAIIVIAIIVLVSFSYYEKATRPSGINHETTFYESWSHWPGSFCVQALKNFSYLGNYINIGYQMQVSPFFHYVNLSSPNAVNYTREKMACSEFCMTTLTSVHWPYYNPVITILNTSLSVNNTIFKNGTDKNDNFGPYWTYSTMYSGNYFSRFYLYEKGDFCARNSNFIAPPISSILNPGNYTFYENISFTITLSMWFMHFTSQPYHLDESWWVLYAYNMTYQGKRY